MEENAAWKHFNSLPEMVLKWFYDFLSGEIPHLSWTKTREKDYQTYMAKEHLQNRM